MRRALLPVSALLLAAVGIWSIGVAGFTFPWNGWVAAAGTWGWTAVISGFWIAGWWSRFRWCWLALAVLELGALVWFLALTPERQFRETVWQSSWGRAPRVVYSGTEATIHDVRDFVYRSEQDYDVRYRTLSFDRTGVETVDLAVSHWDGLDRIAHTMLSFGFADGRHLAVSMETRLPEGAVQGFLPGLYKQYEILMVLATEEDLFKLRTNFRGEEFYLYRTNATPAQARELLELILTGADELYRNPAYYNSITQNCTTSLAPLLRVINPTFTGDIRLLLNGRSDELLYDLGYLHHRDGESFAALKSRSRIAPTDAEDYSSAIRAGFCGRLPAGRLSCYHIQKIITNLQ